MRKLILPLMSLIPATAMWGIDAYFYNSDSSEPVLMVENVRTITLGDVSTLITRADFTTARLQNDTFDHMLFRTKPTSGISGTATLPGQINVALCGSTLEISGPKAISSVDLSAVNGMHIAQLSTPATSISYDMTGLASGIYVVRVQSGEQTVVSKIVKK